MLYLRRNRFALSVIIVTTLTATHVMAQKGAPTAPANWPCVITFHDAVTNIDGMSVETVIRGDGVGPYVNGQSGVSCYVDQDARGSHYGYLFVNAARGSARYFLFPGQAAAVPYSRQGYATFQNRQPGYFEITRIDTVVFNADPASTQTTARRRVRIGVGSPLDFDAGEFWGYSEATDALASNTESAWVTPLNSCSWTVAWHPQPGGVVALREGSAKQRIRTADFAMPFSATVTITGVKPGC